MIEDAESKYRDGIISEEVIKRMRMNYKAIKKNLG